MSHDAAQGSDEQDRAGAQAGREDFHAEGREGQVKAKNKALKKK
jgi:hypothetical protein